MNRHATEQQGAMVLGAVFLLLMLTSMATLYTAQFKAMQTNIAVNNISYYQALSAAESGVRFALRHMQIFPDWQLENVPIPAMFTDIESLQLQSQPLDNLPFPARLVDVLAKGRSVDNSISQGVKASALVYPLVRHLPIAPLLLNGEIDANDQFTLVANYNGAGKGRAVSVWSNGSVVLHQQSVSCLAYEYQQGLCHQQPLSSQGIIATDIIDRSQDYPDDLSSYIFGIPVKHIKRLRSVSQLYADECTAVDENTKGLVWVGADCLLASHQRIGSKQNPVILIVSGDKLVLHKSARIFGLVVLLQQARVTMHEQAGIVGSLIVANGLAASANNFNIEFSTRLIESLQRPPFLNVSLIAGSWRDYR